MPELPEVETTRSGIEPHVLNQRIVGAIVRQGRLRWPILPDLNEKLTGRTILRLERRGKYILFVLDSGTLIVHLGMSGSLRLTDAGSPPKKHDHVDILFPQNLCLRFHDPRRFGCMVWTEGEPWAHPLLEDLGPEPFDASFTGDYLHRAARSRKTSVKALIMDSRVVVGVGNIYANEALFRSGIDPRRAAGRIGPKRYAVLAEMIRQVLREAIVQGGTTLRDFVNAGGNPGYFQQTLAVYAREGAPCRSCGAPIRAVRLVQRSTFFCPSCQR